MSNAGNNPYDRVVHDVSIVESGIFEKVTLSEQRGY